MEMIPHALCWIPLALIVVAVLESGAGRSSTGALIVFDRLLGTWMVETADFPRRYGVAGVASSVNPLRIVFQEWIVLGHDLLQAASWRELRQCVFGAPATGDKGGRQ